MNFTIEINNKPIIVTKGETILSVLKRIGIKVPTLCSMKDFTPTGGCRMCVVEVEGRDKLIPSCSFVVEEWMKIKTHSPKVVNARKTIVELLLADHPDDCLYCERNGNCELQKLAEDLHIRQRRISGEKSQLKIDKSSISIFRDPQKCILCNRCVRVCEELQGVSSLHRANRGIQTSIETAMKKQLNFSNCIYCGQCIMVCPTAAITERFLFSELDSFLHNPEKRLIALYSPTITITLAEEFGIKPGKDTNGIVNAILRKIGFDRVFDTSFGADLVIMEETWELLDRLKNGAKLPIFTSCCPSWVKYAEQYRPEILPYLTTSKSPQQIMGAIIKSHYAQLENIEPENIVNVAIMPCTSKKFEAMRPEMTQKGINEVDSVITTRELARLIRMYGIDVSTIEPEATDTFFASRGSAGKLVGVTGGAAEAALRTIHYAITGNEIPENRLQSIRGFKGIKETKIQMGDMEFGVAVVNGMVNASILLDQILAGRNDIHFVEVMACHGGCINGGGQPIISQEDALNIRMTSIYETDDKETVKAAHQNPVVIDMYNKFLESPFNPKNLSLLHTHFHKRDVLL